MMKIALTIFSSLWLLAMPSMAYAYSDIEAQQLVKQYVSAFQQKNEPQMNEIFDQIYQDPKMHALVKTNHPDEYILINYRSILRKIDRLEQIYGNKSNTPSTIPQTATLTPSPRQFGTFLRGNPDSRTQATSSPNQNRPANQRWTVTANNRLQQNNSTANRGYSNRTIAHTQSNQQRLRRL